MLCYNCGKPGHVAKDCRLGKGKGKGWGKPVNALGDGDGNGKGYGDKESAKATLSDYMPMNLGGSQDKKEPETESVKNDAPSFWFDGQHWWPYEDQWGCYGLEDASMTPEEEELVSMTAVERAKRRERMVEKLSKTHERVKVCPDSGAV